jgi:hypothetical protein
MKCCCDDPVHRVGGWGSGGVAFVFVEAVTWGTLLGPEEPCGPSLCGGVCGVVLGTAMAVIVGVVGVVGVGMLRT